MSGERRSGAAAEGVRRGGVRQAAGTPGNSTADQLSKLAGLKSQGVLTDAEFEAQKSKILEPADLIQPYDRPRHSK